MLTLYSANHFPVLQKTNRLVIFCYFGLIRRKIQKKCFVSEKLKIFKKWVLVPFIVKISKSSNIFFLLLYLRVSHKEQKNSTKVSSAHFTVTSTITDFLKNGPLQISRKKVFYQRYWISLLTPYLPYKMQTLKKKLNEFEYKINVNDFLNSNSWKISRSCNYFVYRAILIYDSSKLLSWWVLIPQVKI